MQRGGDVVRRTGGELNAALAYVCTVGLRSPSTVAVGVRRVVGGAKAAQTGSGR